MFLRRSVTLIALLLGICGAQTATHNVQEPDAIGVFFFLNPATQTLDRLPKEEWKRRDKPSWTTVTEDIKLDGTTSSFQIPASGPLAFVYRGESADKTKLYRFEIKGGKRQFVMGKRKGQNYSPNPGLPVEITKFGESSYKIVPEAALERGQYALFTGQGDGPLFTFGVNASGK